jgi:hypothetical protein
MGATTTQTTTGRAVRLLKGFGTDGRAALVIVQGGAETTYAVERVPSDWGEAFALEKADGRVYHVLMSCDSPGCDCPDGTFRGHQRPCKHYAALAALRQHGRI